MNLDTALISKAIAASPLPEYDASDARLLVERLIEAYLDDDRKQFAVTGIEQRVAVPWSSIEEPIESRGVIDLEGVFTSGKYEGRRFVIDYKTHRGPLESRYIRSQIEGWQWRIYAAMRDASVFLFRMASREQPIVKQVAIEVPSSNSQDVQEFLASMSHIVGPLVTMQTPVWPRTGLLNGSCHKWNETCRFYKDCTSTPPRQALSASQAALSYSSMQKLARCWELFRRSRLLSKDDDQGNDDTRFGQAVHRGMAEAYRQAFLNPGEETKT